MNFASIIMIEGFFTTVASGWHVEPCVNLLFSIKVMISSVLARISPVCSIAPLIHITLQIDD